jgi:hypothetical protein
MQFSRWLFRIAGIYGLIVLVPQFFLEARIGADYPPEVTHPEYFFGFLGVGLAWQIAFLMIATDPVRFRPIIIPSVIEKFSFAMAATVLFIQHRAPGTILAAGMVDLALGVLFMNAWQRLAASNRPPQ